MLGHGQSVSAGGIAEQGLFRQDARDHIGIGAGRKQLKHIQILGPGDHARRNIADDKGSLGDLIRGGLSRGGEDEFAGDAGSLGDAAKAGLFVFSGFKGYQDFFHLSVPLLFFTGFFTVLILNADRDDVKKNCRKHTLLFRG